MAGRGSEGELSRRPAAGTRPDSTLRHEAPVDQLADAAGDDGAAQSGALDELRARPRSPESDLVEDGDEVVEHLVGQRARASPRIGLVDHGPIIGPRCMKRRLLHLTGQSTISRSTWKTVATSRTVATVI